MVNPPGAASLRFTLLERELKLFKNILLGLHKIGPNMMIQARPTEVLIVPPPTFVRE